MGKLTGGTPKIEVTEYYMSVHFGLCSGPVDAVTGIYVGEKEAWTGNVGSGDITINKEGLFGGPKEEGGVKGKVRVLPGNSAQVMPEGLAQRLGKTSATCPGFRGLTSLFFRGGSDSGDPEDRAFYWANNNPYMKSVWARVRRRPRGLSEDTAMIGGDANGAHIIYECLTDTDWGMGADSSIIDVDSFEAVATTLFNEAFGLSLMWVQQTEIEAFVSEVLDHIKATLFVNPRNGLLTLKLIRNDYDIDTLRVANADNCKLTRFQRKAWGETINEIVVTWTNPTNEEEETVTAQDLANIGVQGQIVSDSRNYYGVRNSDLAMKLAQRDVREASAPLATADLELDRSWWDLLPGEVIKLHWPEYGIENLIFRIGPVDYGRPGDAAVKASGLEDIFGLPAASYTSPPGSSWVDPSEAPESIDDAKIFTLPFYLAELAVGSETMAALVSPEVVPAVLAAPPNADTSYYDLLVEVPDQAGDLVYEDYGTKNVVRRVELESALPAEAESELPDLATPEGFSPKAADYIVLGDADDAETEIGIVLDAGTAGLVIRRGILDTVPREWPIGTPLWWFSVDDTIHIEEVFSAGETISTKLLPVTSLGRLPESDAPIVSEVLIERPYMPLRPANVTVDGIAFGTATIAPGADVAIEWANRNRTQEATPPLAWDAGTLTPEDGQTTYIEIVNSTDDIVLTEDELTGTSFTLDSDLLPGAGSYRMRVGAELDSVRSLQAHEIALEYEGPPDAVTSITFIGSTTSTSNTIAFHGSTQAGDIALLHDYGRTDGVAPTDVIPTGFTGEGNVSGGSTPVCRSRWSMKVLTSGDVSAGFITGMNATLNSKVLLIFRPNAPAAIGANTGTAGGASNSAPSTATILQDGEPTPRIAFAAFASSGTVSPRNMSPAMDGEVARGTNHYVQYAIFNSDGIPVDFTFSMDDEGNSNAIVGTSVNIVSA